jgi:selenocysteine-specific translation elongation factor
MPGIQFEIVRVFNLDSRGVVIATGHVLTGVIRPGMTLRIQGTDETVRVIGLELMEPPPDDPGRVGLVIDLRDKDAVIAGRTLTNGD